MKTIVNIVDRTIDDGFSDLRAYKEWYINLAAIAKRMGYPGAYNTYVEAAWHIEKIIELVKAIQAEKDNT